MNDINFDISYFNYEDRLRGKTERHTLLSSLLVTPAGLINMNGIVTFANPAFILDSKIKTQFRSIGIPSYLNDVSSYINPVFQTYGNNDYSPDLLTFTGSNPFQDALGNGGDSQSNITGRALNICSGFGVSLETDINLFPDLAPYLAAAATNQLFCDIFVEFIMLRK